jgi:hypothetical protein
MAAITALNVRLGMDASNFTEGANLARSEVNKVASVLRQSVPPAEKFQNDLALLDKTFSEAGKQSKQYADAVGFLKKKHGQLPPVVNDSTVAIDQLKQSMLSAVPGGRLLAGALSGPAGAAIALAGTAVGMVAAFKLVDKAIDTLRDAQSEIDKTAKQATKLGVTFNELSGLKFAAAEIGGLDGSQVEQSIKQLLIRTSKAVGGDKTINEAFARIGVDAGKAMAAGPLESIKMIAAGMKDIPTQAERLEIAMALFGKAGADIVPILNAQADALAESLAFQEKWNGLTDAQVMGVEAANDAWGRVYFIVDGLTNKLAAEMAPLFGMMASDILGVADGFNSVDAATRKATDSMAMLYGFTVDMITAADTLAGVLAKIASGNFAGAGIAIGGMMDSAGKAGAEALKELYKRRAELEKAAAGKDTEAARLAALQEQTDELGKQSEAYVQQDAHVAAYQQRLQKISDSFDKQMSGFELQRVAMTEGAEAAERMRLAAEGFNDEQIDALMRQKDLIDGMKSFEKETEKAIESAKKYFEEQRKRDDAMRSAVAKGPGSGMEADSAEAAKFMADQANAAMAVMAVPEKPTPGEAEIIAKAQEQMAIAKQQKAVADAQLGLLREQLAVQQNNGFRRLR